MDILEVLLRGLAAGAVLTTAVAFLRSVQAGSARWTGALFCVSVAAFAVNSGNAETRALGILHGPVWVLSAGGTAYFWLFAVTLFEDRPLRWELFLPALGMTLVATVGAVLNGPTSNGVWIVHNLLEVALVAHATVVIWRSRGGDLVEARRTMRGPFMLTIGLYCIVLSGLEIGWSLGFRPHWLPLLQAAILVVLSLLGATTFLEGRSELFGPGPRPADDAPPEPVAPQDRPALARLEALMAKGDIWRREGLTIGQLATEVGVPEHRLRRLINGALGFRNFADFLNARRIEAAKTALADPGNARAPVSALAFDLGYASLGPFNRAFKDATGETPTAWRIQALRSPKPE